VLHKKVLGKIKRLMWEREQWKYADALVWHGTSLQGKSRADEALALTSL
jgi:hypothetical protein